MDKQLVQKFAFANLDVVGTDILPLIGDDFAKQAALVGFNKIKETIAVVLDEDPNNKEQLNLIWGKITSDPQLLELVRVGLLQAAAAVNDETVKTGLTLLVEPLMKTLNAVQDDVKSITIVLSEIAIAAVLIGSTVELQPYSLLNTIVNGYAISNCSCVNVNRVAVELIVTIIFERV